MKLERRQVASSTRISRREMQQTTGAAFVNTGTGAPLASVIISARNNASFLQETIESALCQTIPVEVIYSDDCSTDNSVLIARQFGDRVQVVRSLIHQGVCATRNRGACAANSARLVFVDGDDRIPPDFVEQHLLAMLEGTPFVYPRARIFGGHQMDGHVYQVPQWKDYDQWRQNTCNTSCLYDRTVFFAAGGWRDLPQTMWDWDLSLRATRFGTPRPSDAILDYRYHGDSWSDAMNERNEQEAVRIRERVRGLNVRLSCCCIFSGRLPGLIPLWCSKLAAAVRLAGLHESVEIVILDNSKNGSMPLLEKELLQYQYSEVFSRVRIVPHSAGYSWTTETERRDGVADYMATASNRIVDLAKGDVIWFVEDDILVPMNACRDLLAQLVSGANPPQAVSGAYRNRHGTGKFIVGTWKLDEHPQEFTELPAEPTLIDVAGTGCLMFWKTRIGMPKAFRSHAGEVPAHDWAWCWDLMQLGGKMWLVPSVLCGHAVSEKEIV